MNISINLLPEEFRSQEIKREKFYKIQALGIIAILTTAFFASLTVALRVLQNQNISLIQASVSSEETRIDGHKTKQASLFFLKDRLSKISKYLDKSSRQNETFQSISALIPPQIVISSLAVDKSGSALIVASGPNIGALDDFFTSLAGGKDSKFAKISIESLSRGRDNIFRVSFKLIPI